MAGASWLAWDVAPDISPDDGVDYAVSHSIATRKRSLRFSILERRQNVPHSFNGQFALAATANVLTPRNELQMIWIDATSNPTQVVDLKCRRDRAAMCEPCKTMRDSDALAVHNTIESSVSSRVCGTRPDPTRSRETAIFGAPAFVEGARRSAHGRMTSTPTDGLSFDPPTLRIGLRRYPCRLAASALAQFRSRVSVHAASLREVVNGERGSDRPRFPDSIRAGC